METHGFEVRTVLTRLEKVIMIVKACQRYMRRKATSRFYIRKDIILRYSGRPPVLGERNVIPKHLNFTLVLG